MPYQKASETIKHTVEPVRLAFPDLFEPRQVTIAGKPTGDPRYSARIVIHESQTEVLEQLRKAIAAVKAKAWADGNLPSQFHEPLVEAALAYPKDANLVGCWIVNANARANSPPQVVRKDRGRLIDLNPDNPADRQMVYSGMQAVVSVGLFSYQTTAQAGGIGCGLNAVLATGEDVGRFDARITAASAFGDLLDDDDDGADELGF